MKITNRSFSILVNLKFIKLGEIFRTVPLNFSGFEKGYLMLKTASEVHPDLDYYDDDQEIMCVSLSSGKIYNISNITDVTKVESELIITEA